MNGTTSPRDVTFERISEDPPVTIVRRTFDELLPSWAEIDLDREPGQATARLALIGQVGREVERRSGDGAIREAVQWIEAGSPDARRRIALSLRALGTAARLRWSSRYDQAEVFYRRVLETPQITDTPIGLWARNGLVVCALAAGDYAAARRDIGALRVSPALVRFPSLLALVAWSEGLIDLRTGEFADSRLRFDEAARIFSRLGDPEQLGAARALTAESAHALGMQQEAWRARHEGLLALGDRPSGWLHNLLLDCGLAAREEGSLHAALVLQTAGVETSQALSSPTRAVEALIWRSKILWGLGRDREAIADLEIAVREAPEIPDPGLRRRLTADALEARGEISMSEDPDAAVRDLTAAVEEYRSTDFAWKVPSTLLLRAGAHRSLGDHRAAETDLEAAIVEFERRDRVLPPEIFRYSHFERAQQAFDQMIALQAERGRYDRALLYSERARRATVFSPSASQGSRSTALGEQRIQRLVATLPEDTAVVSFSVLPDRLLVWVADRGRLAFLQRGHRDLEERVEDFWKSLSSPTTPTAAIEARAEALYRDLAEPWIDDLPIGTRLILVPDRYLYRLPFHALRDPARRRWLAQDYPISTAPTFSLALESVRHAGSAEEMAALLVADPRSDPTEAGPLRRLPGAVEEIRRISPHYPSAAVLESGAARKDTIIAELAKADIVHYAGHALGNPTDPWHSYLPLAPPSNGESGLLMAREIHALPYRVRRLVVLSACGRPTEGSLRSAGFTPLVWAFLATGAEAVVASLWSVEDRSVVPLMIDLHRYIRAGAAPAEALYHARLSLLAASPSVPPHIWASLQVTENPHPGSVD